MNPSELKELAAVLNGIADGKPWQIANTEPPDWIDAPPNGCPTSVLTNGCKIRLKPWELGRTVNGHTLPPGAEWHRQDFTEDMLPAPYRPMMKDEVYVSGDQCFLSNEWEIISGLSGMTVDSVGLSRTTRPIPFPLTPEQIADGWVPWNGGECPVEPESKPTVMFRDGGCPDSASSRALRWEHNGLAGDIIAYKPDPYGHPRQALADGKTIQCKIQCKCSGNYFVDIENPAFDLSPDRYRIKEPQWLPLGPEDVPPFSVIRRKGQTDEYGNPQYWHWRLISYVTGIGPVCADRGYNWQELSTDYEINRSLAAGKWDPTAWEPCRKLETETELKQ